MERTVEVKCTGHVRTAVGKGTFDEHLDGLDTELDDGDRVALMYPFVFCF